MRHPEVPAGGVRCPSRDRAQREAGAAKRAARAQRDDAGWQMELCGGDGASGAARDDGASGLGEWCGTPRRRPFWPPWTEAKEAGVGGRH